MVIVQTGGHLHVILCGQCHKMHWSCQERISGRHTHIENKVEHMLVGEIGRQSKPWNACLRWAGVRIHVCVWWKMQHRTWTFVSLVRDGRSLTTVCQMGNDLKWKTSEFMNQPRCPWLHKMQQHTKHCALSLWTGMTRSDRSCRARGDWLMFATAAPLHHTFKYQCFFCSQHLTSMLLKLHGTIYVPMNLFDLSTIICNLQSAMYSTSSIYPVCSRAHLQRLRCYRQLTMLSLGKYAFLNWLLFNSVYFMTVDSVNEKCHLHLYGATARKDSCAKLSTWHSSLAHCLRPMCPSSATSAAAWYRCQWLAVVQDVQLATFCVSRRATVGCVEWTASRPWLAAHLYAAVESTITKFFGLVDI